MPLQTARLSTAVKTIVAGLLITAGLATGLGLGSGQAHAKIDDGRYKYQLVMYGVIPYPESNARVIGNRLFQDIYGVGPWNATNSHITHTRNGGIVSIAGDSVAHWYSRIELRKTPHGYKGVLFAGGVPTGDVYLRKVR
ncbi:MULTISPECIES: hypothetical protein [unclassified Gordonia (in: high G+C Gram-positive bacteria)]|uniref:hypothetical protein n=1 Tax=unclassified Gordonia (in: high G+C Gram-positive bacteria) TaxID=2657482 RepID=UPI00071C522A|nr:MULTISPECIES: hypothetical protein [unclassified Gordonia (in: high G+C Gram-positive bacteria)]KSU54471.1 hypothetical protein AS181_20970 [Gordonia sp. SGD-V-85]SCC53555.1 hypothetical protein GA0061091_1242 [Gordonia sp. v-85]